VAGAGQPLDPAAAGQGLGVGGGQDAVLLAPDDQDRDAQAVQLAGQDRRLASRRVHGGRHRAQRLLDAAVGAVAAEDHDRRHLPLGHGQHGVGRGARVLAQRHLQHLQLGQALGGQVPGAAAEVALEALGEAGAGRHHDHPVHPGGAEPGHEPVHHEPGSIGRTRRPTRRSGRTVHHGMRHTRRPDGEEVLRA
jgi:hypothetical protein